jgi:hypothetical protein
VLLHRLLNCEQCDQVFTSVNELDLHRILSHPPITKPSKLVKKPRHLQCSKCYTRFSCSENLEQHFKYLHGDNPMGKMLTTDNYKSKKVFQCLVCPKKFNTGSLDLINLISTQHTKQYLFKCNFCQKSYPSLIALNAHKQIHSGQIWKCDICSAEFPKKRYLQRHKTYVHSQTLLPCNICKKKFKHQRSLSVHMIVIHEKKKKYKCNLCDKAFSRQCYLNVHINESHGALKFQCDTCASTYKTKYKLATHIRYKHLFKDQIFTCTLCSTKFRSEYDRKLHMFTVHATDTYICNDCGTQYRCRKYLYNHMRTVHIGILLHCAHCAFSSRNKHDLFLHIQTHYGKSV